MRMIVRALNRDLGRNAKRVLVCVLLLYAPMALIGQSSQAGEQHGASAHRDPEAVELLQRSLAALGGPGSWSAIRSVLIKGTLVARPGQTADQISWLADWSTGTLRYADVTTDRNTGVHARRFDGQTLRTTLVRGKRVPVPELDPAARLALRLPAPAIWWVLNHPDYSIVVNQFRSNAELKCIDVVAPIRQYPVIPVLELYVSTSSGLPDHVRVGLPDMLSPARRLWATVRYQDFRQQDGASYPATVVLQWPGAASQLVSIEALTWNATAPPSEFTAAVTGENQ